MAAGDWHSKEELARAGERVRAKNARSHQTVDAYERLFVADRIEELIRFLARARRTDDPLLNIWIVYRDVQDLVTRDRKAEARRLWETAAPLLYDTMTRRNLGGTLLLQLGDRSAAESEFRRSLEIAPLNQVALEGLANAAAVPKAPSQRSSPSPAS
jgi:tetratricopeptide (TPR) repeat protein